MKNLGSIDTSVTKHQGPGTSPWGIMGMSLATFIRKQWKMEETKKLRSCSITWQLEISVTEPQ